MNLRSLASALTLTTLLLSPLSAQADRLELGLRLRQFERHLEQVEDPARRDAAFAELERAVQAFFRLDAATVARSIDAADAALSGAPRDAEQRFAHSLGMTLAARLVPAGDGAVEFTIATVYRDEDGHGDDLELFVQPLAGEGTPLRIALDELPKNGSLPLTGVPEGDHVVRWWIARGDEVLVRREHGVSVVADLDARLQRLEEASSTEVGSDLLERQTLTAHLRTLANLRRKLQEETVLPGHRLLCEAEALVAAKDRFYGAGRTGEFWLRVPMAGRSVPVRLFVPPTKGETSPLVIAVHGAGGSENLFFDGYGDGKVVRLAAERGWYVCAPRSTFGGVDAAALADALAARWPIDRQRVLLVGHSMGAMNVITNATRAPQAFAAVAALGGGGVVPRRAAYAKLPFFVGVGSRDFALEQARKLDRDLRAVSANCTLREYAGVEHLAIVQLALPDVFAFFERALTSPK